MKTYSLSFKKDLKKDSSYEALKSCGVDSVFSLNIKADAKKSSALPSYNLNFKELYDLNQIIKNVKSSRGSFAQIDLEHHNVSIKAYLNKKGKHVGYAVAIAKPYYKNLIYFSLTTSSFERMSEKIDFIIDSEIKRHDDESHKIKIKEKKLKAKEKKEYIPYQQLLENF